MSNGKVAVPTRLEQIKSIVETATHSGQLRGTWQVANERLLVMDTVQADNILKTPPSQVVTYEVEWTGEDGQQGSWRCFFKEDGGLDSHNVRTLSVGFEGLVTALRYVERWAEAAGRVV